jgi:hypothetical protein
MDQDKTKINYIFFTGIEHAFVLDPNDKRFNNENTHTTNKRKKKRTLLPGRQQTRRSQASR